MTEANIPAGYEADGRTFVKYELAFNATDLSATVIRSLYAGVSGPWADAEGIDTREQAEAWAFGLGLLVSGDWTVTRLGVHYAPLTAFKG
jgi:hypothetical protein